MGGETTVRTKEQAGRFGLGPSFRLYVGDKITLDLSPEASDLLNQLLDQTGDSPDDLFRKAIGLYKVAQDAHQEGKAVGVRRPRTSWKRNSSASEPPGLHASRQEVRHQRRFPASRSQDEGPDRDPRGRAREEAQVSQGVSRFPSE
jgi:hypothetical protein